MMEIMWVADTLHSTYRVPCNISGEPEFAFKFREGAGVKFRYEVRSHGELKACTWEAKP